MSTSELFDKLIGNLMHSLPLVKAAAIVDDNGLIIYSNLRNPEEKDDVIGTVTAVFKDFIDRIQKDFGSADNFVNVSTIDENKFVFAKAGVNATLTLVANGAADDARLKVYSSHIAKKIELIISEDTTDIDLSIPPIVEVVANMRSGTLPQGSFQSKIIVLGEPRVGKTSLVRRFVDQKFAESYVSSIGVDISRKNVELSKKCQVSLAIWDIGGQIQQMAPYRKRFYQGANLVILVIDLSRKKTFDNIDRWIEDLNQFLERPIPYIIIGNKNDLDTQEITEEEIMEKAKELDCPYLLTSAKTGSNVDEAFRYCAYKFCERL